MDFVSLGPDGQYFVRFTDGDWRVVGLATYEDELIEQTTAEGSLRHISFGFRGITVRCNPNRTVSGTSYSCPDELTKAMLTDFVHYPVVRNEDDFFESASA